MQSRFHPVPLLILLLLVVTARGAAAQSLRGSPASVQRMYSHAVEHRLHFYQTPAGIRNAAKKGVFVRLTGNADYRVHNVSYPYVRPEVATFVERLAGQYRRACGKRLVVTSATRPQGRRLANSHRRSVHPAGIAVDLRRPDGRCLSWLRSTLLDLERAGVLEATEERHPPHFHVAVFPRPYSRYVERRGGSVSTTRVASRTEPAGQAEVRGEAESESEAERRYRVRRGDTLWSIARRHGVSVDDLQEANNLRSSRITAGQFLTVPGGR